jgi:hypothetical protein
MNNPNYDKTITEGELCELLNVQGKALGVWESHTPNEVVRDGFHIRLISETVTDPIGNVVREKFRLTNTHMTFSSLLTVLGGQQQISSVVPNYVASNTKRTLIQIGFVKSFYRMIDEVSIYTSGESISKRLREMRYVIKHSVTANIPTMLSNILETDWETISMMYFVYTHQDIPAADLNWGFFENDYEFKNIGIDWIMEGVIEDFFERNDRKDESAFVEIKAMLLKWKHEHSGGSEEKEMKL